MNDYISEYADHHQSIVNFIFYWEKIISPIIQRTEDEMDPAFKKSCGVVRAYEDWSQYRNDLMVFYLKKREWLKKVYLPHE